MFKISMSVIATLAVVFAAYCIDGFYLQQTLLFFSGFMVASLIMLED